jgi:hypothetical protein
MVKRRRITLATQWAAVSSFGVAAYLFAWLSQRLPKARGKDSNGKQPIKKNWENNPAMSSLARQLHFGLLLFCFLGILAIPGEFGMVTRAMVATGNPADVAFATMTSSHELGGVSAISFLIATLGRVAGMLTTLSALRWAPHVAKMNSEDCDDYDYDSDESDEISVESNTAMDNGGDASRRAMDQSVGMFPNKGVLSLFQTGWNVPKSHRKQTLFYRNLLLLVAVGALSNLLEAIFRIRVSCAVCCVTQGPTWTRVVALKHGGLIFLPTIVVVSTVSVGAC